MATIKVKFKPSAAAGHQGTIFFQIIHERKQRQLFPGYHVFPDEWDDDRSMVTTTHKSVRKTYILSIRQRVRWDVERLGKIIRQLDNDGLSYTADDVVNAYDHYVKAYSLFNFMESIIIKFKLAGKVRTAETYSVTLNSFKKFHNNEDIMLDCLSSDVMEAYEAWLQRRGVSNNTISFYARILRAAYNRAVAEEIIDNRRPFRRVYTGVDKTVKRALPIELIKKINHLDLSKTPAIDFARDMFMMSFMLRGMSFIDMAYLRKADLADGYVTYRRRKTGQQLVIAWTKEMQSMLKKYPENSSEYLLPIIRKKGANERSSYRNAGYNINHNLKKIAEILGLKMPLTLYVARHSWASAAKAKGVPLSVISQGMGHDSETTTQIYLDSLDTTVVDRANSLILKSI